jgi:LuxR family transcriptional regulator, maltose regulon positive regulatory protein
VVRGTRLPSSAPKGPPRLVHRSRLFERLDHGADTQLTLVVGSPGAGKTMLLTDRLAARPGRRSAWLSCDVADADPVRFVGAIIEAVGQASAHPGAGEDAR